jgi:hypothetical protein
LWVRRSAGRIGPSQLSSRLGYPVASGEAYYTAGCISSTQCVFPNASIPQNAWSTPAKNLLQYIPDPTSSGTTFSTSAFNQLLRDDKGAIRLDGSTRWGMLSAYYFLDDFSQNNPYPVAQGGAKRAGLSTR